jgi:hypothetical protein
LKYKPIQFLKTIAVIAAVVCGIGYFLFHAYFHEDKYYRAFPSPDHNYNAVRITHAGGAGIAGYFCFENVVLMRSTLAKEDADESEGLIYSGPCHQVDVQMHGGTEAPEIKWLSNTELEIGYAEDVQVSEKNNFHDKENIRIIYRAR